MNLKDLKNRSELSNCTENEITIRLKKMVKAGLMTVSEEGKIGLTPYGKLAGSMRQLADKIDADVDALKLDEEEGSTP